MNLRLALSLALPILVLPVLGCTATGGSQGNGSSSGAATSGGTGSTGGGSSSGSGSGSTSGTSSGASTSGTSSSGTSTAGSSSSASSSATSSSSSSSSGTVVDQGTAEVTAAEGGTITSDDGMELTVPPQAVSSDTSLSVTVIERDVPGLETASPVYEFGPAGLTFAQPVRVSIPTNAGEGFVVWWTRPGSDTEFEPVPTISGNGFKAAFVTHFSYGVVAADADPACDNVTCPAQPPSCDGNRLNATGEGTCVAGQCQYPDLSTECLQNNLYGGQGCVADTCAVACASAVDDQGNALPMVGDCDGISQNGCEARLDREEFHCGACNNRCNATEECINGVCTGRAACGLAAEGCVYPCLQGGGSVASCFDQCSGSLTGNDLQNAQDLRACIDAVCGLNPDLQCISGATFIECDVIYEDCENGTTNHECVPVRDDALCASTHCDGSTCGDGGLCVEPPPSGCADTQGECAARVAEPSFRTCIEDVMANGTGSANPCCEGLTEIPGDLNECQALQDCLLRDLPADCSADVAGCYDTQWNACRVPVALCEATPGVCVRGVHFGVTSAGFLLTPEDVADFNANCQSVVGKVGVGGPSATITALDLSVPVIDELEIDNLATLTANSTIRIRGQVRSLSVYRVDNLATLQLDATSGLEELSVINSGEPGFQVVAPDLVSELASLQLRSTGITAFSAPGLTAAPGGSIHIESNANLCPEVVAELAAQFPGAFLNGNGTDPSCPPPQCGNGATEYPEVCDDGNQDETDACLQSCTANPCLGNKTVVTGFEPSSYPHLSTLSACAVVDGNVTVYPNTSETFTLGVDVTGTLRIDGSQYPQVLGYAVVVEGVDADRIEFVNFLGSISQLQGSANTLAIINAPTLSNVYASGFTASAVELVDLPRFCQGQVNALLTALGLTENDATITNVGTDASCPVDCPTTTVTSQAELNALSQTCFRIVGDLTAVGVSSASAPVPVTGVFTVDGLTGTFVSGDVGGLRVLNSPNLTFVRVESDSLTIFELDTVATQSGSMSFSLAPTHYDTIILRNTGATNVGGFADSFTAGAFTIEDNARLCDPEIDALLAKASFPRASATISNNSTDASCQVNP
ncbi:MAG: hypothetical protein AB2A00_13595 [Myxococcota bacterium]